MDIGQIISDTFGMVKARFGQLLGLWAIYLGIAMVLVVGLTIGLGAAGLAGLSTFAASDPLAAGGGMMLVLVLFYVGYLLVTMAQYASLIMMASPIRRVTVGEALAAGVRAAPALLLLMVVLIIGYIPLSGVFYLVGAAFFAPGEWDNSPFVLLLLPVLAWLGCRLSPLFAVVAVDGIHNPFKAIARSWHLTRGHALKIFLVSLLFVVILVVVCGLALLPSIGMLASMADPAAVAEAGLVGRALGGILLLALGMLVASVLINLCYCAFLAAIHGTLAGATGERAADTFA